MFRSPIINTRVGKHRCLEPKIRKPIPTPIPMIGKSKMLLDAGIPLSLSVIIMMDPTNHPCYITNTWDPRNLQGRREVPSPNKATLSHSLCLLHELFSVASMDGIGLDGTYYGYWCCHDFKDCSTRPYMLCHEYMRS